MIYIILIFIMLKQTRSSIVADDLSQQTVYVSNYCPTMKYCKEGTHVMCMYYNHERLVGPLCSNYKKVFVTPKLVDQILHHVNEIRSKISLGKETGKDGKPLPRAYGMRRLQWDSELATLAQVLANQCLGLREDECRATDRFPAPSQIVTLINFKVPDWGYISQNTTLKGLTNEKLTFAIDKALNSLHAVRKSVNPETINECPALDMVSDMGSRSYLKLIRGKATHIGCGMSAFMRYHPANNAAQNIYNSVQLVCNISDGPQPAQPLYKTEPPIPGAGFTEMCGCPPSFKESKGCLCEPDPSYTGPPAEELVPDEDIREKEIKWNGREGDREEEHEKHNPFKTNSNEQCDDTTSEPKVVLLPIFQIQDAPLDQQQKQELVERTFHQRFGNKSFFTHAMKENDVSDENNSNKNRRSFQNDRHDRRLAFRHDMPSAQKLGNAYNSVEDTLVDQNLYSDQNEFDDKINDIDLYNDENKFLSILNMLERAAQNIRIGGKKKKYFALKMKKIYDTVQNPTIPEFTENNLDSGPKILTPIELNKPHDLKNEFLDLTNYLRRKPERKVPDERGYDSWSQNRRRDTKQPIVEKHISHSNYDYIDRKDSENYEPEHDSRPIDNLSKNPYNHNFYKYNANDQNVDTSLQDEIKDRQYEENEEYQPAPPLPPPSRKQETIIKYNNKKSKGPVKRKQYKHSDPYELKGYKTDHCELNEYSEKETDDERAVNSVYEGKHRKNKQKNYKTEDIRPYGRRPYSRSENYGRRATSHSGIYRRILAKNDIKRPILMARDYDGRHPNRERHIANRATF